MKCRRITMKKFAIMVIALALLVVGMAMAEPGVPKVNEVQGLRTSTTVIAMGNFNSESSIDWTISNGQPLAGPDTFPPLTEGVVYQTVYSEDTQNAEFGYLSYDKDLDMQTGNKVSGQFNVKAVKQITYLGIDASAITSTDYMHIDGAGENYGALDENIICPFAGGNDAPSFCNKVQTGSTVTLKVANVITDMGDRFVMKAADPGVEIYNNVGVSAYASDLPSKGSASAYIKGSIKEGGRDDTEFGEDATALYETITFSDSTAISGDITSFAKAMSYSSLLG
jgi:hypothetical protein